MKTYKLSVKTKSKDYSIMIGKNLINNFYKILKNENISFNKCLIVCDNKVPKALTTKLKKKIKYCKIFLHYFNSNEKNKNYKSVNKITEILFKKNFSRNDCLISLGGGITGDVTSFVASTYKRGIKFINIPTTLLAQVDSSIGGKTGINNKFGKNLIGTFYQPDLVISDTLFLNTLPTRELICGYGEILKHSIISSKKNFEYLKKFNNKILKLNNPYIEKAIFESCKIKKKIIEKDEKEKSLRKVLNFGHTFAHSFEATLNYSKKLNHGEAVILGMIFAIKFSYINKMLNKKDFHKITEHINKLNFKFLKKKFFNKTKIKKIIHFMKMDKKNKSSKINLILIKKIGNPSINNNYSANKISSFIKRELIN